MHSPPGGVKEQLGIIFKLIREAQTLDVNGDEMVAAYVNIYLPSVFAVKVYSYYY